MTSILITLAALFACQDGLHVPGRSWAPCLTRYDGVWLPERPATAWVRPYPHGETSAIPLGHDDNPAMDPTSETPEKGRRQN